MLPIITAKVSSKVLDALDCRACNIHYKNSHNIILIKNGTSNKIRLHEIYHCKIQPNQDDKTYVEFVEDELNAEIWAFEICNHPLPIANILNVTMQVMDYLKPKYKVGYLFNIIISVLYKNGYKLSREQKSLIWNSIKYYAKTNELYDREVYKKRLPYILIHK